MDALYGVQEARKMLEKTVVGGGGGGVVEELREGVDRMVLEAFTS